MSASLFNPPARTLDYADAWWTDDDEDAYERLVDAWSCAPAHVVERFLADLPNRYGS